MTTPTPTNEQMDAAILEYRGFKTAEEYHRRMAEDSHFRRAIEAAYQRGVKDPSKNFTIVDAGGWHAGQYCAPIPPARPNTNDIRERGPRALLPIPGAAFPS